MKAILFIENGMRIFQGFLGSSKYLKALKRKNNLRVPRGQIRAFSVGAD